MGEHQDTPIPPHETPPPRPDLTSSTAASGMEDGFITIRGMESIAIAFIAIPAIREHQAAIIQERLLSLAERSKGRMAVSLADVADMTSAGVNAFVAINNKCTQCGGRLALFGLSRDVRKLFKVTKLDRAITITESAHEAVRSFEDAPRKSFWKQAFTWANKNQRDAA